MHSIYPNLDKRMLDHGIKYKDLAEAIGMDWLAMYRRLKGISTWKLPEIVAVCQFFNENNAVELFTIRY